MFYFAKKHKNFTRTKRPQNKCNFSVFVNIRTACDSTSDGQTDAEMSWSWEIMRWQHLVCEKNLFEWCNTVLPLALFDTALVLYYWHSKSYHSIMKTLYQMWPAYHWKNSGTGCCLCASGSWCFEGLWCSNLQGGDEDVIILWNISNCSRNYMVSHVRKLNLQQHHCENVKSRDWLHHPQILTFMGTCVINVFF
jgi:hypothetical protein